MEGEAHKDPVVDLLPIPQVTCGRVLGLLEYLDDHNDREDIYKLAREIHYEFGEVLSVIKMAEMLGLVDTPGGDVVLLDLGRKVVKSKIDQRKAIVREQLSRLKIFSFITGLLSHAEENQLDREVVLDELTGQLPQEDTPRLLDTIVNWGRYAELIGYSSDTGRIFLDEGP